MTASHAAVSMAFGALLAGVVGYAAWRLLERSDPVSQARRAGRHARLAVRATKRRLAADLR